MPPCRVSLRDTDGTRAQSSLATKMARGGRMRVVDAPIAGAAELLREDREIEAAYERLISLLISTGVPRQTKAKSSPRYIYDQRELQSVLRAQLRGLGWTHGRGLSEDTVFDGVRTPGIQADLIGSGLHVILEFGNRASWAHNLLTRVLGAVAGGHARLTVFVTPTDELARQIDANLGSFERVATTLRLIERWSPHVIPGPLMLIGVGPDRRGAA